MPVDYGFGVAEMSPHVVRRGVTCPLVFNIYLTMDNNRILNRKFIVEENYFHARACSKNNQVKLKKEV
ncbi:hypothetical protein DFS33DRAFT_1490896 [Desarmillaria ectypa]|nr:hypothetical protein DFS33DRAFT_1490896 [Desarmillaria ectypa]